MLKLFDDMDDLLATQPDFLLETWIKNARRLGVDEQERLYDERNARNIITTWGGKAQSINDYANRSWAGLTKSFYKKRWEIFITELIEAVKANKEFDEKAFKEHVTDFEWKWVDGKEIFSDIPKGNSLQIAQALFHTYKTYYP